MKKILMIAYHYPPYPAGSGIHRTLKFSRYLSENGWQPVMLTPSPRAYHETRDDRIHEIPQSVCVTRAFALDAAKHFSIRGSYFRFTALPDRWASWWFGAVPAGLHLIRAHRPDIIWSTYPIATAHLIGLTLHRMSGIPWVADFRDPMTEEIYPYDPLTWKVCRWIERQTVRHAACAVFTTRGTLNMYAERYLEASHSAWKIIENGYDEEDFLAAENTQEIPESKNGCLVLIHSGILYSLERDPRVFFAAISDLRRNGKISPSNLKIILRGSGNEESYAVQLKESGIEDIVFLERAIPYREALAETLHADGLLLFQASNTNHCIPAKMYEYFRAGRPIFALTDPQGDTGSALKASGIDTIVPLDSKEAIASGLLDFLNRVREGKAPIVTKKFIESCSRKHRTKELAALLNSIA